MNSATRLRTDFKMAVDHIKDRVISNVNEAKRQKNFNIEDAELKKLVRVIEMSFEQGFSTSAGQIEKSINEVTR